jgi:hypothetical protein
VSADYIYPVDQNQLDDTFMFNYFVSVQKVPKCCANEKMGSGDQFNKWKKVLDPTLGCGREEWGGAVYKTFLECNCASALGIETAISDHIVWLGANNQKNLREQLTNNQSGGGKTPLQISFWRNANILGSITECCEGGATDGSIYESSGETVAIKSFEPFKSDSVNFRLEDIKGL